MKRKITILLAIVLIFSSVDIRTGFQIQAQADDLFDVNEVLPLNGKWSNDVMFTETFSRMVYKVEIPSDGLFTFRIKSYNDNLEWYFYRGNSSNYDDYHDYWTFRGATDSSPITKEYSYGLSKGTYYIICKGGTGRYQIQGTFESYGAQDAYANSYDSPQDLPMGQTITGASTISDREDWFRIHVPEAAKYAITVRSYMADLDWYLYDVDRVNTLDESTWDYYGASSNSPQVVRHNITLSAGTYYIRIKNSKSGKYQVSWDKLSTTNCSHSYESSYVSSTYFTEGYTIHKCKNCGYTYKDNFQKKRTLGGGYIYSLQAGKKKFGVSYSSISDVSGYQIRYSTNKKLKKAKTVKVGKSTYSKTIKKLKKKKKYYVQVRGYKTSGKKIVYGAWSAKRSVKTK